MLFRRSSRRRDDPLRRCPSCRSRLVCPTEWEPSDDSHWRIELRCADCGHHWEAVMDDSRAARYDIELDGDLRVIKRALQRMDLERMAVEVETFSTALSRDLIEPADFVA
jgi:hypothetical protein